eukprot:scaffold83522_cov25-Tisochrysis_lutea.AAC.1
MGRSDGGADDRRHTEPRGDIVLNKRREAELVAELGPGKWELVQASRPTCETQERERENERENEMSRSLTQH